MGEVSKEGRTVLFVSHNIGAIKSLCNRAILLNKGRLESTGNVASIVGCYVGQQLNVLERVWEDSDDEFKNKGVEFRKISIVTSKDQENIDVATPIMIDFEFVNHLRKTELHLSLEFMDINGTLIFATHSDYVTGEKGMNLWKCCIPPFFFNDEKYYITVRVIKNRLEEVVSLVNVLSFKISDIPRDHGWMGKWPGLIRPKFNWTIMK